MIDDVDFTDITKIDINIMCNQKILVVLEAYQGIPLRSQTFKQKIDILMIPFSGDGVCVGGGV